MGSKTKRRSAVHHRRDAQQQPQHDHVTPRTLFSVMLVAGGWRFRPETVIRYRPEYKQPEPSQPRVLMNVKVWFYGDHSPVQFDEADADQFMIAAKDIEHARLLEQQQLGDQPTGQIDPPPISDINPFGLDDSREFDGP